MTSNHSTSLVTIAGITVRTDTASRFSLNDLHQAAGGEAKNLPGKFLRLQGTQALVSELEKSFSDVSSSCPDLDNQAPVSSMQGAGTYVVKELVYAYAMWISPAFHLKVIRAYDALVTQPAAPSLPALPAPNQLAEQLVTVHAGQIAELLSQQSRLIALLEQRPAAPALPAPAKPKVASVQRMTTAHWLDKSGLRYTSSQKRQINDSVRSEYHEAGHPFECTKNGWGLFSGARIKLHAERILGEQKLLQF